MTENSESQTQVNHISEREEVSLELEKIELTDENIEFQDEQLQLADENDLQGTEIAISENSDTILSDKSNQLSSRSNVSDESSEYLKDEILNSPDNISLCLSTVQEENDKLKQTISNLEIIISDQQKAINTNETKLLEFQKKCDNHEKIRSDLEHRLQVVNKL